MDFATRIAELQKRTVEHREVLLTEEAAKTALVMPFLQSLGYDVFNPTEVIPEFTADVGIKKGEKVDYAVCFGGKLNILIECKPSSAELNVSHASQLFRYFAVTDARLAILTNGVNYLFFSDIEKSNKMDDKPFFTFSMDAIKPQDVKVLGKFTKSEFDIDTIMQEAGSLKVQSLLRKYVEDEFRQPSDEYVKLFAGRVLDGRVTASAREGVAKLLPAVIAAIINDRVNERLSSALNAGALPPVDDGAQEEEAVDGGVVTTQEEISGYRIIQAIASRLVDPKRVVMRDSKSYCAILLDNNNRKTIARLWFNSPTTKHLGTFDGRSESKQLIPELTSIYQFTTLIEKRIEELDKGVLKNSPLEEIS